MIFPTTCKCGKEIKNQMSWNGHQAWCPLNKSGESSKPSITTFVSNSIRLTLVVRPKTRGKDGKVDDWGKNIEFKPDTAFNRGIYETNKPDEIEYIESHRYFMGLGGSVKDFSEQGIGIWRL